MYKLGTKFGSMFLSMTLIYWAPISGLGNRFHVQSLEVDNEFTIEK